MEKFTSQSPNPPTTTNDDHHIKQLNKLSRKISKPPLRKNSTLNPNHLRPPPLPESNNLPPPPPPQPQPPVYNVEKSQFRDLVQKLTGAPAPERLSNPPPINPPKPQSSRLQRIRPPPLAQVSHLPPPLLNDTSNLTTANKTITDTGATNGGLVSSQRQVQPVSPLPPFPAVHAAAESPISAYMRYLHSSNTTLDSDPVRFLGFSPLSPCNLSANQFGFLQFPLSPTLPLPSPTGKGH